MKSYHPVLVVLHWVMALMIIITLFMGKVIIEDMPNGAEKLQIIGQHMIFGLIIGALLVVRIITKLVTKNPEPLNVPRWIKLSSSIAHVLFYLLMFGMVASGLAMAFGADLFTLAYGGEGTRLPRELFRLPQTAAHGLFAVLLIAMIALHLIATVYHKVAYKHSILPRIWFTKRRK